MDRKKLIPLIAEVCVGLGNDISSSSDSSSDEELDFEYILSSSSDDEYQKTIEHHLLEHDPALKPKVKQFINETVHKMSDEQVGSILSCNASIIM